MKSSLVGTLRSRKVRHERYRGRRSQVNLRLFVEPLEDRLLPSAPGDLLHTFLNPTPAAGDEFANSVAATEDRILIGGHFGDVAGVDDGAAYLFDTSGNLLHTFLNPTPDDFDQFGANVAFVGDNVLIGAPSDDTGATNAGAAYLFDASGNLLQSFFNPTPIPDAVFGGSVASVGDKILIGAVDANSGGLFQVGEAYLFDSAGTLLHTFVNPTPSIGENFGNVGTRAGSDKILIAASKVNDAGPGSSGAVYLYDESGTLLHTFTHPSPEKSDEFGHSIDISGDKVLIGAGLDDAAGTDAGAAFLFDTSGNLLQTFLNPSPNTADVFGVNVAFVGDNILIGAEHDDDAATEAGAAYLFDPAGNLLLTLRSPTPEVGEQFGNYVAAAGNNLLIGAIRSDAGATNSGAAYLFRGVINPSATISGTVFIDADGDGLFDGGTETGIDGVTIQLLDTESSVLATDVTELGGVYAFTVDDVTGTFRIREIQPTGVDDGMAILGDAGGTVISSNEMQLTLTGSDASDYDFTEVGRAVQGGDTATIGFWQNKNGQALIKEGGAALLTWLNDNFSNIFGTTFTDGSGGDDDAEVASFYKNEFFKKKLKGTSKVDAQFMSLALAAFFTSSNLSGGSVAAGYGFNVTETGIGTNVVNVGANGAAFAVADNADMTIMALLLATNDLTDTDGAANNDDDGYTHVYDANGDGVLSDAEKLLRAQANALYSAINEDGDI